MPGKKKKNRWKRCTALVLAGSLLAGTMTEVYAAGTAEEYVDFYGDTVRLYTASDLRSLAKKCSQKKYSEGRTFLLENDIDLENTSLTIPCMAGTFDGQGHKITNTM